MHIYIYMYIYIYVYIYMYVCIYVYINSTMRHLSFSYISILTNLPRIDNKTKSVKTIYN